MTLSEVLAGKRVIVCGGSGGVGKTTLSAALGMALARQGKRCVVITVDPAQRLADALGIAIEGGQLVEVPLGGAKGSLHAMMLTPERAVQTFMDKLLHKASPDHPIVNERFFQQGMAMLAASPEYLAVQELYDLSQRADFDVIVLDTPPTRQSIDFLTAPNRLAQALQGKSAVLNVVRPYLRINRAGFNLIKSGARAVLGIVDKIFGIDTFVEFFSFFESAVTLLDLDQLEDRIHKVNTLLRDAATTFLVVAAPNPTSIEEALYFHGKIAEWKIAFGGFVINRVQPDLGVDEATCDGLEARAPELAAEGERRFEGVATLPALVPKLISNLRTYVQLRKVEQEEIGRLRAVLAQAECLAQVPRLDQDVHDLEGIGQVAAALRL